MNNRYQEIARELIQLFRKDYELQEELSKTGELYKGYHPQMEFLHKENARFLDKVIKEIGWPGVSKIGPEGAFAAWLILQHAISDPDLQRNSLPMLQEMADNKEIAPYEVAMLYDRICYFEMRPQKFGTQFDFDENNELNPWVIEDVANVDKYRSEVGLPPLQETVKRMREVAKRTDEKPLGSYQERLAERKIWAKKVGWIK